LRDGKPETDAEKKEAVEENKKPIPKTGETGRARRANRIRSSAR